MGRKRLSSFLGNIGNSSENSDVNENISLSSDEVVESVDAEVKRVSDLFRFILKYKQHFQPSGVEFSGLRQYLVTDDASRIDWKHSAGSPDLYVKQYEEEKNMDTFILLDGSSTMDFGTAERTKTEYASVVASTIAYASVDAGIDVGIGIYSGDSMIMSPDGGNEQYRKILHEVTNQKNYGGNFNLEDALNEVMGKIKDETVVFIISDFIDVEGDWQPKIKVASHKFRHVMGIMLRDIRDFRMPESGNMRLESPEGDEKVVVNTDSVKKNFEEAAEEQERRVEENLKGGGASFLKITTEDDFSAKFASYFDEEGEKW